MNPAGNLNVVARYGDLKMSKTPQTVVLAIPQGFSITLTQKQFDLFTGIAFEDACRGTQRHRQVTNFRRSPVWPTVQVLIDMGLIRKTMRREPLSYRSRVIHCCTDIGMQIARSIIPEVEAAWVEHNPKIEAFEQEQAGGSHDD